MDLILLKPGNDQIKGASLINGEVVNGASSANGQLGDPSTCIELVSMHYSMKQQITTNVSNSARTSGRPELTDITAIKYFDQSSPLLYQACLGAMPIGGHDDASLTRIFLCRNNNDTIHCIMTIELTDAIVSSIECQSHPNDMPTEQLTINFTGISWIYSGQTNDMQPGGQVVAAWSASGNRITTSAWAGNPAATVP